MFVRSMIYKILKNAYVRFHHIEINVTFGLSFIIIQDFITKAADLAQLVERKALNLVVMGSRPMVGVL